MRRPLKAPKRPFQERELYSSLIFLVALCAVRKVYVGSSTGTRGDGSHAIYLWSENHPHSPGWVRSIVESVWRRSLDIGGWGSAPLAQLAPLPDVAGAPLRMKGLLGRSARVVRQSSIERWASTAAVL